MRDPSIGIELLRGDEPPPVSRSDGPVWDRVAAAVQAAYPAALPVPYVMVQASDARHHTGLGAEVYRFTPFAITAEELASIHRTDERLSIRALDAAIAFHRNLLSGR
jgi:carboxypeptidase PM20D1